MKQIIQISQIPKLVKYLSNLNKTTTLVGGCFDVVHLGHLTFLKKAALTADVLIILLESDENIKKIKGDSRPINSQINRAKFLTHLKSVDFIILLPEMKTDQDYLNLVTQIKPNTIAVTKSDPKLKLKSFEAKSINANLLTVTNVIPQQSTSLVIKKCYNTRSIKL